MGLALALAASLFLGGAEVLPLSGRGCLSFLMAVESDGADVLLPVALAIGSTIALAIAGRRRLVELFTEGAPLLVSPSRARASGPARDLAGLLFAAVIALPGSLYLTHAAAHLARAPLAQGLGMWVTGVMLASTLAAPPRARAHLGREQAIALGLALALAALPGGSFTGAAFAALVWTGVSKKRAVDLAFLAAIPEAVASLVMLLASPGVASRAHERPGLVVTLAIAAVAGGLVGAALMRRLAERRVAELAGFEVAIASAFVAYAWALTGSPA